MPKATQKTKSSGDSGDSKEPRIEVFNGFLSDGRIFETIYNPKETPALQFVIASSREPATIQPYVEQGEQTKYPPNRLIKWIGTRNTVLASGVAACGDTASLLQRIKAYLGKYLDFPAFEIALMAHYAMMTWVWDEFTAFPYLRFKGEPGTGKTRSLQTLHQLCYRGTKLGGAPTLSALFRIIDKIQGTVCIDEANYSGDLKSELMQVLNEGYQKDGVRVVSSEHRKTWEADVFKVGCPKILAGKDDFPDRALETRCLTIYTPSKKPADHIPTQLPPAFWGEGQELRNQLLRWRIDTLRTIPKSERELRRLDGRMIQLALPLYSISPDAGFKEELLQRSTVLSRELQESAPLRIVLEAIVKVRKQERRDIFSVDRVRLETVGLAKQRDVSDSEFTSRKVSALAHKSLGFHRLHRNAGTYLRVDNATLKRQCEHLGVSIGDESDEGDAVAEYAALVETA